MTSFVTTATTMFNRFPLRHSKKEPTIGVPALYHSTRKDPEKNLPPLPNEHFFDFTTVPPRSPTRYTTTPNFDIHPILPSSTTTTAPPFLHAVRVNGRDPKEKDMKENILFNINNKDNKEPTPMKKSGFRRKEVPNRNVSPIQQRPKNVDVLEAVNSAYHSPTYSSYPKSIEQDRKVAVSPDPMPSPRVIGDSEAARNEIENDRVGPMPQMKMPSKPDKPPRLRDSIIPAINPIDKSFLGDFIDDDEDDPNFEVQPLAEDGPIVSSMPAAELFGPNIRVKGDMPGNFPGPSGEVKRKARPDIPFLDVPLPPTPKLDLDSPSCSQFHSPKLAPVPEVTPPPTPQTPEEHIAQLERQRDFLTSEQRRLNKEITNLEGLLPPNPSTHSFRQREALKADLNNLRLEYAGVVKDLHEIGMLLHRAWRRRDVRMGLEAPAVLWVRRCGD